MIIDDMKMGFSRLNIMTCITYKYNCTTLKFVFAHCVRHDHDGLSKSTITCR